MNGHFRKANIRMISDHIERCSASPSIRDVQTKTTGRHYILHACSNGKNRKDEPLQVLGEIWSKWNCVRWWCECKIVRSRWEMVCKCLEVKRAHTIGPSHSTPRYFPKRNENVLMKKCLQTFTGTRLVMVQNGKGPERPPHWQVNGETDGTAMGRSARHPATTAEPWPARQTDRRRNSRAEREKPGDAGILPGIPLTGHSRKHGLTCSRWERISGGREWSDEGRERVEGVTSEEPWEATCGGVTNRFTISARGIVSRVYTKAKMDILNRCNLLPISEGGQREREKTTHGMKDRHLIVGTGSFLSPAARCRGWVLIRTPLSLGTKVRGKLSVGNELWTPRGRK